MQSKRGQKGQASIEYAMVAVLVGILILPAVYLLYSYSQKSVEQIDLAQLDRLGKDITAAAEKVYYMGPPSRLALESRLPAGVRNVSVMQDWTRGVNFLIFNASVTETGVSQFMFHSDININGSFSAALENRSISPGQKEINVEAYELQVGGETTPFVYINFGGRCPRSTVTDYNTDGVVDGQDWTFFNRCYCDTAGYPKFRPTGKWKRGWFDNSGAFSSSAYALCMNVDYDADCDADQADADFACAAWGALCGAASCPPP